MSTMVSAGPVWNALVESGAKRPRAEKSVRREVWPEFGGLHRLQKEDF